MPFITEEFWHAMYDGSTPAKSIALSRFPQGSDNATSASVESEMSILQELIVTVRALRKDLDVPERESVAIQISASRKIRELVETSCATIEKLARAARIEFPVTWNLGPAHTRTTANFTVGSHYEKQIDVAVERERLRKKLEQYEKVLINAERQLGNDAFLAKAPEKVVSGLKKQASEASTLRQETLDAIEKLEQLA